jgi:hypothetical protein
VILPHGRLKEIYVNLKSCAVLCSTQYFCLMTIYRNKTSTQMLVKPLWIIQKWCRKCSQTLFFHINLNIGDSDQTKFLIFFRLLVQIVWRVDWKAILSQFLGKSFESILQKKFTFQEVLGRKYFFYKCNLKISYFDISITTYSNVLTVTQTSWQFLKSPDKNLKLIQLLKRPDTFRFFQGNKTVFVI